MKPVALLVARFLACLAIAAAATPKTPTFFARRDYPGLRSDWAQVADVNGDGIPDIVAAMGGYIETLVGNGDGTFSAGPSTLTILAGGGAFTAIDLDGNGITDLVVPGGVISGGTDQWGMAVCLGNGDGTFRTGIFYPAGTDSGEAIEYAIVADLNSDGIPDVLAAGASGIWLFTGKGHGAFNPGVLAIPYKNANGPLAAADFNSDGKLDLVVTLPRAGPRSGGAGFLVLLGNGNGTFQPPVHFSTPKQPQALAIGTLTQGGYPSMVLSSVANTDVYIYTSNGAGGFSTSRPFSLPVATGIAIGDVNGDGIPDLVSTGGYIALGRGNGTFKKPLHYPVQNNGPFNVVLADLRNNGRTDIVSDVDAAISVLLSLGKGRFEDGNWTAVTGGAGCGAPADYNGDGKPDLAVNTANGITILLGTGKSTSPFTTGSTITLAGAGCPITGDLNNDGVADLLVPANGSAITYLGNGDGTFTQVSSTAIPTGGYLVLADFNQDGKLDFATSGNLFALGNGDGTFQTPVPLVPNPPSQGFAYIAMGDLNGDRWPDVVLTDPFQNRVFTLVNNQQGGFTKNAIAAAIGTEPAQIGLSDLNGDGKLDAVIGSLYGGAFVFLGDGKGGLTQGQGLIDPIGISGPQAVADINGDGIPDICLEEGGSIAIYLGDGTGMFESPFYVGAGQAPGDILVQNLHGQSPSAGLPDIVLPDLSGGVTILINTTRQ